MMKRNTYDPVLGKMRQEDLSQRELKQMRTKLNQKSDVGHKHRMSDISDYTPVSVDTVLSDTSTNPVQNKKVKEALDSKADGSVFQNNNGVAVIPVAVQEGSSTVNGTDAHAEGNSTEARGAYSHSEGRQTLAQASVSHAEGYKTKAKATCSHTEGEGTEALGAHQHVCGKYNIKDTTGEYAFIIGNGSADNIRSNALAVKWDGTAVMWINGSTVELTPANLNLMLQRLSETYAAANHNHDSSYAAKNHNHDSAYAAANHNHDNSYANKNHTHSEYLTSHQDISGKQDVLSKSSNIPIGGILPGVFYDYGTLSANITINLAAGTGSTVAHEWHFRFKTDANGTYSVTLPDTMPDNTTIYWNNLPEIESDTIYECSIMEGGGVIMALTETI